MSKFFEELHFFNDIAAYHTLALLLQDIFGDAWHRWDSNIRSGTEKGFMFRLRADLHHICGSHYMRAKSSRYKDVVRSRVWSSSTLHTFPELCAQSVSERLHHLLGGYYGLK